MAAVLNKYRCKINRQRKKIALLSARQKKESRKIDEVIEATSQILPRPIQQFLKSQLKAVGVAPSGRRYTDEDLMFALAIYYQGPRAYRFLRKRFFLPSPRLLRRRMEHIQTRPGFSDAVVAIMKEKLRAAPAAEKLCIISFDEMMVKSGLTYIRGDDMVEGFEDFGSLGRTSRPADHALVFMARGLRQKWKQPLGFFLSAGPTTAEVLENLLMQCIAKLQAAGFVVAATVCDMGTTNQELYSRLGVKPEEPTFVCGGKTVTALFDVPHLFKCIRNGLYKYDVEVDGKLLSWQHIKAFYDLDSARPLRFAPKLKRSHLVLKPFKKMKVKLATQVMSRTVASGMTLYSSLGMYISLGTTLSFFRH